VVNVSKGSLDVAYLAGAVATIATLNIGYISNVQADSNVRLGVGCTLTTIAKTGGTLEVNSAVTTLGQSDGTTTILAGAIGTLTMNGNGGTVEQLGNGTMATVILAAGTLDFTEGESGLTVTTIKVYGGATLLDPNRRVTWTNPINLEQTSIPKLGNIDVGTNISLAIGTAS
jgi:hypothetical protein